MKMTTLTQQQVKDFLGNPLKEPYKMIGHQWVHNKHIGKQVCKSCGLVCLNNEFTSWCVDKGCMNDDHPQYQQARKRYSRMKHLK